MPRRTIHPLPGGPGPAWLQHLREALFATLPALDEAWAWEGERYVCQRHLDDRGEQLIFTEQWLDRQTYAIKHQWTLPLQAAAFVGLQSEALFQRHVTVVLQGIEQARPRTQQVERLPVWQPDRYAKAPSHGRMRV